MAIVGSVTLQRVATTKKLPPAEFDAFAKMFAAWVRETFEDNQTHAGRALGISQSHVSALLSGDRGPGLPLLITLRERTGRSIDEWLGLSLRPPAAKAEPKYVTADEMRAVLREELTSAAGGPPLTRPDRDSEAAAAPRRRPRA